MVTEFNTCAEKLIRFASDSAVGCRLSNLAIHSNYIHNANNEKMYGLISTH